MIPLFRPEIIQRIKHASAGEFTHRIRKKLAARKLKAALEHKRISFTIPSVSHAHILSLKMPDLWCQSHTSLVQRLLSGETFRLNTSPEEIIWFEDKHRNSFFDSIKLQTDDPDIRAVWETARLQNATLLLRCNPKNKVERQFGKEIVLRWIQTNPFLRGPHYMSAMECGLRVPVFFYCLKSAPNFSNEERATLLRAIYEHAWWIENNLSLFASLGNHTVCECLGLIFAGAVFKQSGDGERWIDKAFALLKQESKHQILDDGGPAEQSIGYHRFVLDLFTLVSDSLEKNALFDCSSIRERVVSGERFLKAFSGPSGKMPSIGDCDDGQAVAPGAAPRRVVAEELAEALTTFPKTGYSVVRGPGGFILTFDHGPLGMPPLFNHGHADALALTISYESRPIFLDPGTYRYNGVPEWRRYFKGTRAHNTVTVDGQDQAVQETGFIWSRPFNSKLLYQKSGQGWVMLYGCHDGYKRLKEGVVHQRALLIEACSRILIRDSFIGKGVHDFELNFHLHPDAVIENKGGWILVKTGGVRAFVRLIEGGTFEVIHGRENPIHGWYSPAYGVKAPSPVLSSRIRTQAHVARFLTVVTVGDLCDVNELKHRFWQIEKQAFDS